MRIPAKAGGGYFVEPPLSLMCLQLAWESRIMVALRMTRPEELDLAARYGFRAIYALNPDTTHAKYDPDDEAAMARLAARVDEVKDHPALYVYQHWDEPGADKFPAASRVADFVRARDPNHALWINLLPTYANNRQLGIGGEGDDPKRMGFLGDRLSSYWEYVRLFCETYRPRGGGFLLRLAAQ